MAQWASRQSPTNDVYNEATMAEVGINTMREVADFLGLDESELAEAVRLSPTTTAGASAGALSDGDSTSSELSRSLSAANSHAASVLSRAVTST